MPEELKAAMRGLADTAIKVLREAMEGDDPRARILAANTVLDRGYGKATQPIVAEGVEHGRAHLAALQELSCKARQAGADQGGHSRRRTLGR